MLCSVQCAVQCAVCCVVCSVQCSVQCAVCSVHGSVQCLLSIDPAPWGAGRQEESREEREGSIQGERRRHFLPTWRRGKVRSREVDDDMSSLKVGERRIDPGR